MNGCTWMPLGKKINETASDCAITSQNNNIFQNRTLGSYVCQLIILNFYYDIQLALDQVGLSSNYFQRCKMEGFVPFVRVFYFKKNEWEEGEGCCGMRGIYFSKILYALK